MLKHYVTFVLYCGWVIRWKAGPPHPLETARTLNPESNWMVWFLSVRVCEAPAVIETPALRTQRRRVLISPCHFLSGSISAPIWQLSICRPLCSNTNTRYLLECVCVCVCVCEDRRESAGCSGEGKADRHRPALYRPWGVVSYYNITV